jgi:hypothetical protein
MVNSTCYEVAALSLAMTHLNSYSQHTHEKTHTPPILPLFVLNRISSINTI